MKKRSLSPPPEKPVEGDLAPFLGMPESEVQPLGRERFPNIVVAMDGTVVATWGRGRHDVGIRVRRSEDGGRSWAPDIVVTGQGYHGGGTLVDETTGHIFLFVEDREGDPKAPQRAISDLAVFKSADHGKTWAATPVEIAPDGNGNVPSMHMAEAGITLRHGQHPGRLLRASRVYNRKQGYNNAIYSDDHGQTWKAGAPFPNIGTGEGAVAELSDGRIYYSSRKHGYTDEEYNIAALRQGGRMYAWSRDDGQTWVDPGISVTLADGPRYRGREDRIFTVVYQGEERQGYSFNGHFGCMAGLVRLPVSGQDILLYSNVEPARGSCRPAGSVRAGATVWASFDGGATWPVKRLVDGSGRRTGGYSSLSAGRPGTESEGWLYLQFESHVGQSVARFNLAWLLAGERTDDGIIPALKG